MRDTVESANVFKAAIERKDGPSALILSRQNLQHQPRSAEQVAAIAQVVVTYPEDCAGAPGRHHHRIVLK